MLTQNEKFKYSISKNCGILVASFSGVLDFNSISEFETCSKEIFSDPSIKFIAIDFSNVENVTMDAVPSFIQLQKTARDQHQEIRLCGLGESLREKLLKLGVIRYRELSAHLKEAVLLAKQIVKVEAFKKAC